MVGYPEVIQIATWGSVPTSRHLVRKSSTDEMGVCQPRGITSGLPVSRARLPIPTGSKWRARGGGSIVRGGRRDILTVEGKSKQKSQLTGWLNYVSEPAMRNPAHRLACPTCYMPPDGGDHCHESPSWTLDVRAAAYRVCSDGRNFAREGTIPSKYPSWGGTGPCQGCRFDSDKPQRRDQSRQ